jgi:hypothetical protein
MISSKLSLLNYFFKEKFEHEFAREFDPFFLLAGKFEVVYRVQSRRPPLFLDLEDAE